MNEWTLISCRWHLLCHSSRYTSQLQLMLTALCQLSIYKLIKLKSLYVHLSLCQLLEGVTVQCYHKSFCCSFTTHMLHNSWVSQVTLLHKRASHETQLHRTPHKNQTDKFMWSGNEEWTHGCLFNFQSFSAGKSFKPCKHRSFHTLLYYYMIFSAVAHLTLHINCTASAGTQVSSPVSFDKVTSYHIIYPFIKVFVNWNMIQLRQIKPDRPQYKIVLLT